MFSKIYMLLGILFFIIALTTMTTGQFWIMAFCLIMTIVDIVLYYYAKGESR